MTAIYRLGNVIGEQGEGWTKTIFENGAEVVASHEVQADQVRTADAYHIEPEDMNRMHDLTHSILAAVLGIGHSPTLRGVATGEHYRDHWREERAVLALQSFAHAMGVRLEDIATALSESNPLTTRVELQHMNGQTSRLTHAALMNDHFAKIDRDDHGVYHLFTAGDGPHADPHDHAEWGFTSRIVTGGYVEEIFERDGTSRIVERKQGEIFRVEAHTIHRILHLTAPETVTHVGPDHHTGAPHAWAYQFRDDGVWRRPVFGGDWVKL